MNVYEIVTKTILDRMINGEIPWREVMLPKKGEKAQFTNPCTGTAYSALNCLLLGAPGQYSTWNQIKERGGRVNDGAKSHIVTFWNTFIPKEYKDEAEKLEAEGKSTEHLKQQTLKYYRVFNLNDVTGMKLKKEDETVAAQQRASDPTDIAEMALFDYRHNEGIKVVPSQGDEVVYDPGNDTVHMPEKTRYALEEDYYASLFSGMVHSTATSGRVNRETELKKMADGEVSPKEELIAEIGSSMILTSCGLKRNETHEQIAAICQKWVEAMNKDYRLIVYASSGAEKAARYILGGYAA
jgi:antirestriction protein ArdC